MTEERRSTVTLSEEQINEIASRAAKKALDDVYADVGRSVVKKFLWFLGVVALGVWAYLNAKGYTK